MTTTTKKMTKRDYFNAILTKYALTEDEKAFVKHEIELLDKKNSADKKPTAQQVANRSIQDAILDNMAVGAQYTITDLIKSVPECAELTNQRVSALVRQLVAEGAVVRIEDKRKAYFALAN